MSSSLGKPPQSRGPANNSLERTQPQRGLMYDVAVLRRSARSRLLAARGLVASGRIKNMNYKNLVKDFALRTRKNLVALRELQKAQPEAEIYEVTQLINSMLGLLVFPQQKYVRSIPKTPLDELVRQGWPVPQVDGNYPQAENLNDLVRLLRNSISHCNMEFQSDSCGEITGLVVWNTEPRNGQTTWRATMTIEDIEKISDKFIDLLLKT